MDKLQTVLTVISSALGLILTVILPLLLKAYIAFKRSKVAITEANEDKLAAKEAELKAAQMLDMTNKANEIIEKLEQEFATQNAILKQADNSLTLGPIKKECALATLSEFATDIGAKFDREYWSKAIDDIVKLTRNVNSRAA